MISFDIGTVRFNYRVAAIALHDSHVLLHRAETEAFWALPGGRCEVGEASDAALAREMREELGVSVKLARLVWVVENFFTYAGAPFHEIGLYSLVELPEEPWLLDKGATLEAYEERSLRLFFRWFPLETIPDLDIRPGFLRTALRHIPTAVEHIVNRDAGNEGPADVRSQA